MLQDPVKLRAKVVSTFQQMIPELDALSCRNMERSIYNYSIQEASQRKIQNKWTKKSTKSIMK
jgi:hypothetical protein